MSNFSMVNGPEEGLRDRLLRCLSPLQAILAKLCLDLGMFQQFMWASAWPGLPTEIQLEYRTQRSACSVLFNLHIPLMYGEGEKAL
jgi:hypothetical protein